MTIDTCEELDDAVEEYLEYRRFPNTVECFRSEIRHRKLMRNRLEKSDEFLRDSGGVQSRRSSFSFDEDDHCHREKARMHTSSIALLNFFDLGDMPGILSAWSAFIPKPLLRREASSPLAHEVRVAEFLSCVHCAVFPFRPAALAEATGPREASVACAKSMSSFRRYLDRAALPPAQDHEVVNFYALPHVPDPSAHPAFKDLFEESWSATLRARIENLIGAVRQWRRSDPRLVRLLFHQDQAHRPPDTFITAGGDNGYGAPGMVENAPNDGGSVGQVVENQNLRAPPHSNSVVGESPGSCGQGEGARWDGENAARRRGSRSSGTLEGSSVLPKGQQQRLMRSDSDRAILGRVDYKAVKRDLRRLAEEVSEGGRHDDRGGDRRSPPSEAVASAAIEAALLLQTVRWRFARAPPGKTRRGVLYHLIRNDVFDLRLAEAGKEGGAGHAVDTTLLELLFRLGAPPLSSPSSSLSPPLLPPSSEAEKDEKTGLSHDSQPQPYGMEQAPEAIQQQRQKKQPGRCGDDGCVKEEWGSGEHGGGWEEFGGDPGRLVAAYAARLLSVLVSMSKARSYVLGEKYAETIALLAETVRGDGFRETSLAKRLLGVMARLSTRRHLAQEAIAASCFVDWAAKMLGSHFSQGAGSRDPCPLILKRTAEILGNALCTSAGKAAAVAATPDLLSSLGNLLEHEDGQVRSHAIRALRLLLEAPEARERALATGMDAVLQDLRSRTAGSDNSTFARDIESLLDLLGGKLGPDADQEANDNARQEEADVDVEDFDSLSDDDSETEAEASVVSYFVRATNAPCGEELLRERYRLSTAEAKEEGIVGFADGRPPWGGEEEELVCGGYKTRKAADGGYSHHHGAGDSKEAENKNKTPRVPTPEAGTATLIRGEEKVYDSRRPGLPDEMQSRPRIPRTPAGSLASAPFGGSGRRESNGIIADAKSSY